jgi:hypothetical protein
MGRCDPGDQILLKIQSAQNRFKSNGSVGLVITNPTQLVWVQTNIQEGEISHSVQNDKQVKKRDADYTVRIVCTDADVAGRTTRGRQLCGQLACDMACLQ